jgi:hypothetical protein
MSDQPRTSMWKSCIARMRAANPDGLTVWCNHSFGVGILILWTDVGGRAPHSALLIILKSPPRFADVYTEK